MDMNKVLPSERAIVSRKLELLEELFAQDEDKKPVRIYRGEFEVQDITKALVRAQYMTRDEAKKIVKMYMNDAVYSPSRGFVDLYGRNVSQTESENSAELLTA